MWQIILGLTIIVCITFAYLTCLDGRPDIEAAADRPEVHGGNAAFEESPSPQPLWGHT